ncbi:MAG: hypothetical protein AAFW73_25075 [Bacteroidota bacterium]
MIAPKTLLWLALLLPLGGLWSQEPIQRITRMVKAPEYYVEQVALWEKETRSNPQEPNNWYNYFIAAHYAQQRQQSAAPRYDLAEIVAEMQRAIPNTFEAYYFQYWIDSWSEAGCDWLDRAYRTDPDRYQSYLGLITCGELNRDAATIQEFARHWYHSEDYSPGLASWNYNMLVNLEREAILLTNGDNDTYPAWVLQSVKGFRRDVEVINSSMLAMPVYRNRVFADLGIPALEIEEGAVGGWTELQLTIFQHLQRHTDRPLYLAISVDSKLRNKLENNLYLVGMALRYSEREFDNLPHLRQYYEQEMRTDAFGESLHPDPAAAVLPRSNLNYLPALIRLLQHYRETEETTWALRVKKHIRQIAEAGDALARVEQYLKE